MNCQLYDKFNVSDSTYCSYPLIPYWNELSTVTDEWGFNVTRAFRKTNDAEGISLYIHLPFCEKLCFFCGYSPYITSDHNIEQLYIDHLLREWELYIQLLKERPKLSQLYIGGGTPTFFSAGELKRLVSAILSSVIVNDNAVMSFEGHVMNTSAEQLQALYELGFREVTFGVQDLDHKVQQVIRRVQPFEELEKKVREAHGIGYTAVTLELLYGLPMQERKTVISTLNRIKDLQPARIVLSEYRHNTGKNPAQRSLTEHLPIDVERIILKEISAEKLKEMGYVHLGMDHYVLPGDPLHTAFKSETLHRNYMGYLPFRTSLCIGLGVSAISDTWLAAGQNSTDLKKYYERIQAGKLAVDKGYFLTKRDSILRKHIYNIQCRFHTSWENEEDQHPVFMERLAALESLVKNGLISMEGQSLRVRRSGESFLREICSMIDIRLDEKRDREILLKEKPVAIIKPEEVTAVREAS